MMKKPQEKIEATHVKPGKKKKGEKKGVKAHKPSGKRGR